MERKQCTRVQQVAWQSVSEPGIVRPLLMTFLLDSTTQDTGSGRMTPLCFLCGSLSQSISLSHWVMGGGEPGTWGESTAALLDRCAQGSLRPAKHIAQEIPHGGWWWGGYRDITLGPLPSLARVSEGQHLASHCAQWPVTQRPPSFSIPRANALTYPLIISLVLSALPTPNLLIFL